MFSKFPLLLGWGQSQHSPPSPIPILIHGFPTLCKTSSCFGGLCYLPLLPMSSTAAINNFLLTSWISGHSLHSPHDSSSSLSYCIFCQWLDNFCVVCINCPTYWCQIFGLLKFIVLSIITPWQTHYHPDRQACATCIYLNYINPPPLFFSSLTF